MSAALSASRANSRPSKPPKSTAQQTQIVKSEGPPSKMQPTATPEQIRMAQMISDPSNTDDEELRRKIEQIMELTNRSSDDVQIALHDCENDTERAVNYLLEQEPDQGVWRKTGKKKKRVTPTPVEKIDTVSNHVDEKTEKREKSQDRDPKDKPDFPPRRGRRNDSRPPRLSRGRGRDRADYFKADKEDGENEKDDSPFGRERNFERGRGRGRGRGGPRRAKAGGNRFNRGAQQTSVPRFDSGPQIDTWTNETAENAEKENSGWGDTWVSEDWNEDCWSGSLTETQVFTAKTVSDNKVFTAPTEPSGPGQMNDTTNTLGTRLDLGALLQKSQPSQSPETSFSISQYNQQATESIKNSIGIGSASRPMMSEQMPTPSQPTTTVSQLGSFSQNSVINQTMTQSSTVNRLPTSQPMVAQPPQQQPVSMPQRPKPQRTKLPPPSKIPASAVEMPGKMVTSLDVQFGNLEFGADTSPFSFGGGNDSAVSSTYTDTVSNSASVISNHMSDVNQSGDSVISTSIRTSGAPNKSQMAALEQTSPRPSAYPTNTFNTPPKKDIASLNQVNKMSPPDPIAFPGSPGERKASPLMGQRTNQGTSSLTQGSMSTTKPETESMGSFPPVTYQSSSYQSRTQTGLPSSSPYPHVSSTQTVSSSYAAQFPVSTNQFQTSQNQYQTNPNQYQTNKKSFQNYSSGSSSFQNQSGFNSSAANQNSLYQSNAPTSTFQTQTAQNLYHQGTTTPSSFQTQSNSAFHSRDSQSSSNFQTTVTQSSSSFGRDSQSSSTFSRDGQNSVSFREAQTSFQRDGQSSAFQRDSTQNSAFPRESPAAYQRDSQSSGPTFARGDNQTSFSRESQPSGYPRESAGSYTRDTQSASTFPREGQTFQREAAAAAGNYQRDTQAAASVYPRDSQAAGSYTRESQSSNTFPRENQSASSYTRDTQSASYPRDSQNKTSYARESQNAAPYPRESQTVTTYQRENTGASSYQRDGTAASYQRDGQTPSSYQRDSQTGGSYPRDSQTSSAFTRDTQSAAGYSRDNQTSFQREGQSSFQRDGQSATTYQRDGQSTSAFSTRDGQSTPNYQREAPSASAFQRESQTSASFPRDSQSSLTATNTQSQTTYTTQNYNASGHQTNLQTSPLNANKLGDTLSKMSVKENSLDATTSQFDSTTSTSTTSLTSLTSLTTTTSSTSLASVTTAMVTATASTTTISSTSTKSSTLPVNTTKAPPNLTPGIPPLLGHQYIMGQGTIPPFYPLYSYEDLQLLQQRLPVQNNYYDMGGFPGVPTTMTGREQTSLANVQYSATDNKITRVDAQSPIPTSQQQSSQSAHQQPYINLNYGYYYPTLVPGGGFQYPAMFPMPPVTNAAHAGTTPNSQYQKTYASHGYSSGKGYDDITQTPDFTKAAYGMQQAQAKVSGSVSVTSVGGTSDLSGYGKSHAQAFDKQGYAGTPPPFNLPLATGTQAGHMGAPSTPYGGPFVPVMTHQPQPHSQMMHLLQDSTGGSTRGTHSQQTTSQPKTAGTKPYAATYWPAN